MNFKNYLFLSLFIGMIFSGCNSDYDVVIKNGTIYDGSGDSSYVADIGIIADTIAVIGDLSDASASSTIDAEGLAVSPGFINMLSWANYSLLNDGRSMSDIKQGVTLEIFGEGSSMGPVKDEDNDREWTTLGGYLEHLTNKGVSTNVASFVGATTIRTYVLGRDDVTPTDEELHEMQELVREAMREGALGVGTSLIYAPAFFADTEELIALSEAAAEFDGTYISHIRSEGDNFLEAAEELLTIATEAEIDAQFFHLKAAGERNWDKLDVVLDKIDSLRNEGHGIAANMYTYTAASTGLDATLPPWAQAGSTEDFIERLKDPEIRERITDEVRSEETEWENFYQLAGDPENILLLEFNDDSLKQYTGKNLGEVSEMRDSDPVDTIIDLIIQNEGDIGAVYFLMSEENVARQIQIPYMSFGSDARSVAAEGDILNSSTHPRTYGNFARLLGKYVRDEGLISLEEAIYRLTHLSAQNLKINKRGLLEPGYHADIVIFDPELIEDKATFEEPHQYAVGVRDVFVNGVQVLDFGQHTGEMPGQVVRGPGYEND